jgi:hypothetical protein
MHPGRVRHNATDTAYVLLEVDLDENLDADAAVALQIAIPHQCGVLGLLAHSQLTSESAYLAAAAPSPKDPARRSSSLPAVLSNQQSTYAGQFQSLQKQLAGTNGVELPALSLDMAIHGMPGLQTEQKNAG